MKRNTKLKKFKIENFKSIESLEIDFEDLNIVAGPNSSGKSTIPQAMLTWIQAINDSHNSHGLDVPLSGELVKNPPISDLKNNKAKKNDTIAFSATYAPVPVDEDDPIKYYDVDDMEDTIRIEIEESSKGMNWGKIREITSTKLGLSFTPIESSDEDLLIFIPYPEKYKARNLSYGPQYKASNRSMDNSVTIPLSKLNTATNYKVIPVVARDIVTNKKISSIKAIQHTTGGITNIYVKSKLYKVWHAVFKEMMNEANKFLGSQDGGMNAPEQKIWKYFNDSMTSIVINYEEDDHDTRESASEAINEMFKENKICSVYWTDDINENFDYDSIAIISGYPSKEKINFTPYEKKSLLTLAKEYDFTVKEIRETKKKRQDTDYWLKKNKDALEGINKELEEVANRIEGIYDTRHELPYDLLPLALKNLVESHYLDDEEKFLESSMESTEVVDILNVLATLFQFYWNPPDLMMDDAVYDLWSRSRKEISEHLTHDYTYGRENTYQSANYSHNSSLHSQGDPNENPPWLMNALNDLMHNADFFKKVNQNEIFIESIFKKAFTEVKNDDVLIPIDMGSVSVIENLLVDSKLGHTVDLHDLLNYVNSEKSPLHNIDAEFQFVSARPENITQSLSSVRDKLKNNEREFWLPLDKSIDADKFNKDEKWFRSKTKIEDYQSLKEMFPKQEVLEFDFRTRFSQFLIYLGLAENVSINEKAFGELEMNYLMEGSDKKIREISVGSGVTQVGPIIEAIMESTSRPSMNFLFLEEPETHLHPSAQQKLADVLYDLPDNVHIYIETHSEYIINRLRLRQLEQENDDGHTNSLNISFVQIDNGETKLSKVAINEFGAIENWPKGFFDQGMQDGQRLLELGIEKKNQGQDN